MLRLGFSGTRTGLNDLQRGALREFILKEISNASGMAEGHHGDCIGGDEDFHNICKDFGLRIVGHPPNDPKLRAFRECDELWPEKPYMERNIDIVLMADIMLFGPKELEEVQRSGTWSTFRHTKRQNMPYIIFYPNGEVDR